MTPATSTPMSNRFKQKLKEIRDESQRRAVVSHKARTDEDLHRSEKTVQSFDFRERVEAVIDELVLNFQGEAPGFVLHRGFFEGKYMLAMRLEEQLVDESGKPGQYFSRLVFLLDPHSSDDSFTVECRKTIRNRDLETLSRSGAMATEELEVYGEFVEQQFLTFAEAYFADTDLTRPPTAGAPA